MTEALAYRLKTAGRKLEAHEQLFKYTGYWRVWSRVIAPRGSLDLPHFEGSMVEVDLTPINFRWKTDDRVRRINIRKHCTSDCGHDRYAIALPHDVWADMNANLDASVIEAMMDPTLIDQIDWALYQQHNNGGCPLELCRKQ